MSVDIRFVLFEIGADFVDEGDRTIISQLRGVAVVNKKLIGAEEDVGVALKANAVDRRIAPKSMSMEVPSGRRSRVTRQKVSALPSVSKPVRFSRDCGEEMLPPRRLRVGFATAFVVESTTAGSRTDSSVVSPVNSPAASHVKPEPPAVHTSTAPVVLVPNRMQINSLNRHLNIAHVASRPIDKTRGGESIPLPL